MLDITLLGTAALMPLPDRALTAALLSCQGRGILFDCGEGTQTAARRAGVSLMKTGLIALTHYHGDHIFGLPGLLQTMSFERFGRYFTQQKQSHPHVSTSRLLIQYRDYIQMSEALSVDLSHKAIRFPADCVKAHDLIIPRFNEIKHEAENKLFAAKASALYEQLHITEYVKNELCIVLPQKRSDMITEGQSLNHCVGLDRYYMNHIAGTKMIFFIRKAANPAKPFFTMELDMKSFRILQLYGFGNRSASADVKKFAESYVRHLARANMTAARTS